MSFKNHYNKMYSHENINSLKKISCKGWAVNRFEFAVCHAPGGKVLCDVGCGSGEILYSLKDKYSEFIGFDVSDSRLAIAKKDCEGLPIKLFNDQFDDDIHVEPSSVDTIICLDVLDHMIDVRKAIMNFHDILKVDGILILSVPNVARIDQCMRFLVGKFPSTATKNEGLDKEGDCELFDGGKLNYFTFNSMIKLLEEVGFNKIKKYGIGKYKKIHNIYPELLSGSISLVCIK